MKYVLIGLLKVWRLAISPIYGDVCRYYPSCSAYALRSVQFHGAVKGSYLATRRLLRCHPWASGGYDPVPGTPEFHEEMREQAKTAATLYAGLDSDVDAKGRATEVPGGHTTQEQLPHRPRTRLPYRQGMQGSVVTVAQGRGVK